MVGERNNLEVALGSIFYTRQLKNDYIFKQEIEEDGHSDQITRIMSGYPKQENYPNDEVDKIILDAIQKNYPKSYVRNDTILFSIDLEKLEVLKRGTSIPSIICFSPEFRNLYDLHKYFGRQFSAPV